jgi:AP endonuclease-2
LSDKSTGYSGVVIYTRNSTCAPIRAEEGITGILTPPSSDTSFVDLPEDQQIGGYPTMSQALRASEASSLASDYATLDSEGRAVILEFPGFVLIGTYCPAQRDETRDDFRVGFLNLLDARIRNLVSMGKEVILTGDLNISRDDIDSAPFQQALVKEGISVEEYFSMPGRRLLNQMLDGGRVYGERDEGREQPVMWDITRAFHPTRKGMYTCWETKKNARPGNFGARIDYVLCSLGMKDWFSDSNIQDGLLGSDHCPVYATMKDSILVKGLEKATAEMVNPPDMFRDGQRVRKFSPKDLLPLSGKLIPEFTNRRSIRDMFSRKPSLLKSQITELTSDDQEEPKLHGNETPVAQEQENDEESLFVETSSTTTPGIPDRLPTVPAKSPLRQDTKLKPGAKRKLPEKTNSTTLKRVKSATQAAPSKGQRTLQGFFSKKPQPIEIPVEEPPLQGDTLAAAAKPTSSYSPSKPEQAIRSPSKKRETTPPQKTTNLQAMAVTPLREDEMASNDGFPVHDPIVSKNSWDKLFTKPAAPRCEHDEPCKSMLTKKPGVNCGRSFWMCARPLGPSGAKERGTEWRCSTFIWCSDWREGA